MKNRESNRILSFALVVAMVFTLLPGAAVYAEGSSGSLGSSGVITAFDELAEDVAAQSVTLGTSLEALSLPETLTATITSGAGLSAETDSGETATPTDADDMDIIDEDMEETAEDATPTDADDQEETSGGTLTITTQIPVTWQSEPEYDGDTAGTYSFAAEISDEYTVEDGVEPPVITVTVEDSGEATQTVTIIIAEDEYSSTVLYLPEGTAITDADLLAGVSAADETGNPVEVTIQDPDGLDMDNPQMRGTYPNLPYVITYAAGHPVTEKVFTTTREVYVTLGAGAIMPLSTAGMPVSAAGDAWDGVNLQVDVSGDSLVYFGMHDDTAAPVPWRIMELDSDSAVMLSHRVLYAARYDSSNHSNWSGSEICDRLNDSLFWNAGALTSAEKGSVLPYGATEITNTVNINIGQNIVLPSYEEVNDWWSSDSERIAYDLPGTTKYSWWLRSPHSADSGCALVVGTGGNVGYDPVFLAFGVRPAFRLNPKSVIFSSEILDDVTDKPWATEADGNYSAAASGGANYKLTIVNDSLGSLTGSPSNSSNISLKTGETLWLNNLVPSKTADDGDYTVNYKIVNNSGRTIEGYGFTEAEEVTNLEIDTTGLDGSYTVYTWLQKNNEINSHEGTTPEYFTLNISGSGDTYGIGLDMTGTHDFGSREEFYTQVTGKDVGITATGNITNLQVRLSGMSAGDFTVSNENAAGFTIAPNTGLPVGNYSAAVTVTGDYAAPQSFTVSFEVTQDTTTPTVTSVTPSGNAVAASTSALSVTFSKEMNTGVTGTVSLDNGASVSGGVWQSDNKTIEYSLSGLAYGTTYDVAIFGFKDVAGNVIDSTVALGSFTTEKATPTLTLTASEESPVTLPVNVTLTATLTGAASDNSGKTITFDVNGTTYTVTTNSSGVAEYTLTNPTQGTHSFGASFAGDAQNNAATATIAFYVVQLGTQTALTINGLGSGYTYGDDPFTLSTSGGSGGGAVTYTSSNSDVASVSGDTVTILKAGTFTITATKAADSSYAEATVTSSTVTVSQADPTVTLTGANVFFGENVILTVTVSGAGATPTGTVTFMEDGLPIFGAVTLSGGTASYTTTTPPSGGDHYYSVYYSGQPGYYNSGGGGRTVGVDKIDQTGFAITDPGTITYGDSGVTLTASGGQSSGGVTFSVQTSNVISVTSGGALTIIGAGTVTVTATKAGDTDYNAATAELEITVNPRNISNVSVTVIGSTVYTGSQLQPAFSVSDGSLAIDTGDYYNDYGTNIDAGTGVGSVTLTGQRNYTGTKTVSFDIGQRELTDAAITLAAGSYLWTGGAVEPDVTSVVIGGVIVPASEYDVSYTNNIDTGTATVTVTARAGGNYTGTKTVSFDIGQRPLTGAAITLVDGPYLYTGDAIEPTVTSVVIGSITVPASEYDVSYTNNIDTGTATVTVTARAGGNYTGTKTVSFDIGQRPLTGAAIALAAGPYLCTGAAIEPTVASVVIGSITVPASEYDVSYTNNIDAGTATVTVTASAGGNFSGSASADFIIDVSFTSLDEKLTEAKAITQGNYTTTTWNALQTAIISAETVRQTSGVTQTAVNAEVTALTAAIAGLRTSSGGSSSSDSSGSDSTTYTIITDKQPNLPKAATLTHAGTAENERLTFTVTKDMVRAAITKAGTDPDGIALVFNITGSGFTGQTINFTADAIDLLKSSGAKYVQVQTGLFRFRFDDAAIAVIDSMTTGTVAVTADPAKFSGKAAELIGSRPAFDVKIQYQKSDGITYLITNLGSGIMTRGIKYTPASGENTGNLYIIYVDGNGTPEWVNGSSYADGWVNWAGNSCSVYGVGYVTETPAFTDTANH